MQEASRRPPEQKRKAEAHERTYSTRSLRRATGEREKAEDVLNDSMGCLGTLVKRSRVASLMENRTKLNSSKMRWR